MNIIDDEDEEIIEEHFEYQDKSGVRFDVIHNASKYKIDWNGVFTIKKTQVPDPKNPKVTIEQINYIPLFYSPIAPIKRYLNKDTQEVEILVAWYDNGWQEHKMSLDKLLTRRGVQELSKYGVNFTDTKSGTITEYFSNLLELNRNNIITIETYKVMGWKNDCQEFVIGRNKFYMDNNVAMKLRVELAEVHPFIDGLEAKGDIKQWLESTRPLLKYPNARFSCYAVIASFLLVVLHEKSRLLHRWFDSSSGKTTIHDCAMSLIGNPTLLNLTGAMTSTGLEEMLKFMGNVPANFDDLQTADEDFKKQLAYLIGNQKGKLRGKKDGGMREVNTWCSLVLATSETALLDSNSTTGSKVRAFEVYGGLGAVDADAVDKFNNDIIKEELSYGHLTPWIISTIIGNKPMLFKKFSDAVKLLTATLDVVANDGSMIQQQRDSLKNRLINSFAVFLVAGWIFEATMANFKEATVKPEDIVVSVMKEVIHDTTNRPYHLEAIEYIYDWIKENQKSFTIDGEFQERNIPTKIYGDLYLKTFINIHNKTIKEELLKGGYDFNRCRKDWIKHKIISDKEDNRVRIDGTQLHGMSFNVNIIKALTGKELPIIIKLSEEDKESIQSNQKLVLPPNTSLSF